MRPLLYRLRVFLAHGFRLARSYRLSFAARYVSTFVSVGFFYFLDRMFRSAGVEAVEGGDYFTFLLIGNAITRYLELGMRAFAETLRDEMLRGTIEPLLVTATPTVVALLGPSAWMLVEGTLIVFAQFGMGALLGADFDRANWVSAVVVSFTSIGCLLCYGVLSASFTLVFKRSDPINWLIGVVAYLFSGAFFPISVLPPALRLVSYALPFTYAVRALRSALLTGSGLATLWRDLLILLAFTAILLPLSLWAMGKAVRHLKATGELSHY